MIELIKIIKNNWGDLASMLGLLVSIVTLIRVANINKAQREEREVIRKVLDLEELHITIEETIDILTKTIQNLSVSDKPQPSQINTVLSERINSLARTSEKFSSALNALSTLRGDNLVISSSHLERGQYLLHKQKYIQSIKEFEKSLSFYQNYQTADYPHKLMETYYYLARCYFEIDELIDVKKNLMFAIQYAKEVDDKKFQFVIGELAKKIEDKELKEFIAKARLI